MNPQILKIQPAINSGENISVSFEEVRALCCKEGVSEEEVRSVCQCAYAGMDEDERKALLAQLVQWALWLKKSAGFEALLSRCRVAEIVFSSAFVDWRDPRFVRVPRREEDKVDLAAYAALYEKEVGQPLSEKALAFFARKNAVKFLRVPVEKFEDVLAARN